ncbi:hypothetical protein B0J18DRAFT_415613 [Chaetomium sp. MPI-SDFR-AT-0129]|nr:hypothetical protein B0J18DRAFT_415613 [Chaetomium sp. MPI-SDFR-AT-0129]
MANQNNPTVASYRPSWSPSHHARATTIPRRYVRISAKQQALLNRSDSWVDDSGFRVPPSVLNSAKERYGRTTHSGKTTTQGAIPSDPPSPIASEKEPDFPDENRQADLGRTLGTNKGNEDEVGEDNLGSWPPSPPSHFAKPHKQGEHPRRAADVSETRPSKCYGDRAARHFTPPSLSTPNAFPSSCATSEPGLEIEVPQAVPEVVAPVNRQPVVALLKPTPPSAQINFSVPTGQTSPPRRLPANRSRLMKPPATRFANPTRDHLTEQSPGDTGSILPRPLSSALDSPMPTPRVPLHHPTETSSAVLSMGAQCVPLPKNPPETARRTPSAAASQRWSNSTEKLPPNGPSSQVPYTAFKVAYPDYNGSLNVFLRGAMCVAKLCEGKALPEFLYDDFVRVFSTDFLEYVRTFDDSRTPLPAIQFYNENVSRPSYLKGILTRDNINDVASKYPEESRAILQTLKKPTLRRSIPHVPSRAETDKRPLESSPGGPDLTHLETRIQHLEGMISLSNRALGSAEDKIPTQTASHHIGPGTIPNLRSGEATALEARTKPLMSTPARQPRPKNGTVSTRADTSAIKPMYLRTQVDSSLPDIKQPSTRNLPKHTLPPGSAVSKVIFSQLSNADSIPEARLKRRAAHQAPGGWSTGGPGSGAKKMRLSQDPGLAKVRRFGKFLQKIKSSTPPGGPSPSAAEGQSFSG